MNTTRLLVVALALALNATFVHAGEEKKTEKPCESACECPKDKDGKECGVDKDCCCTGKKAEKKG